MTLDRPRHATTHRPDFYRDVHCILGVPFDAVTLRGAVAQLQQACASKTRLFLSTPNLNFLMAAQTDAAFRDSVVHSNLSVADGMPIVWLARLLGVPIHERVAGASIFQMLMAPAAPLKGVADRPTPIRVFFFGGPDGVAKTAHHNINSGATANAAPGLGIQSVGYESPGFGSVADMSQPATIQKINASGADFLVVALGASKGQAWIEHNLGSLNTPVISHLGAVVNFVAGKISRAPLWLQRVGCEWLWRIKEEPTLWRRYLADGTQLVRLLCTRILPLAWLWYRKKPRQHANAPTAIAITAHGPWQVLALQGGPWVRGNLGPLRDVFDRAASEGWQVKLDLQAVTFVDSAFLGLLILFSDWQHSRHGAALQVVEAQSQAVNQIFNYAGLGSMLKKK